MLEKLVYVILTFHWIIIPALVTGSYQACSKLPVIEGRRSEINCYLDENVALTGNKFNVYRHDNFTNKELVLACQWLATGDAPECVARSGYTFDPFDLFTTDSQSVTTIVIPYVSRGHAGAYSCQSSQGGVSTASYTCTLDVLGDRNSCTAGRVTEGERSTIVCHFNQDLRVTKGSFALRHISETGDHKTLFACNWGKFNGRHVCSHASGYTLTSDITHSVAISIPKTMPQNGGQYRCVTVPEYRWVTSETCTLEVTAKDHTDTSPIPSVMTTPVGTSSDTENLHSTKALLVSLLTASFYFG